MVLEISQEQAVETLKNEASKIRQLITNQHNYQCIAQCKAFEEVIDTQMYGFSKQVEYAVKVGIVEKKEGNQLISELEFELNNVYNSVYDEQKEKIDREERE